MTWGIYLLSAGLLPVFLYLGIVFLVLGYAGRFGSWITIRESKRRSSLILGYLSLTAFVIVLNVLVILVFGPGQRVAFAQVRPTEIQIPEFTSTSVPSLTPTDTTDPLLLVLGTPTPTSSIVLSPTPLASLTPTILPTPTRPLFDTSSECVEGAFYPPCTYTVKNEYSPLAIARAVTGSDELADVYAGLIRDLIRNTNGYVSTTPIQVRVPNAEIDRDLNYYRYYFEQFEWDVCTGDPIDTPCFYVVEQDFSDVDLTRAYAEVGAELFPSSANASACIEFANSVRHLGGNFFVPKELPRGTVLVIPNLAEDCLD